jgi:hypothetical protein
MAKKEDDSQDLYVGIEDPVVIRRALLESSKGLISILKANDRLRDARTEKHRILGELKGVTREIAEHLKQFKAELPPVKPSSLPKHKEMHVVPPPAPKPIVHHPKPHKLTEAEKLDKELREIELKLNRLH